MSYPKQAEQKRLEAAVAQIDRRTKASSAVAAFTNVLRFALIAGALVLCFWCGTTLLGPRLSLPTGLFLTGGVLLLILILRYGVNLLAAVQHNATLELAARALSGRPEAVRHAEVRARIDAGEPFTLAEPDAFLLAARKRGLGASELLEVRAAQLWRWARWIMAVCALSLVVFNSSFTIPPAPKPPISDSGTHCTCHPDTNCTVLRAEFDSLIRVVNRMELALRPTSGGKKPIPPAKCTKADLCGAVDAMNARLDSVLRNR